MEYFFRTYKGKLKRKYLLDVFFRKDYKKVIGSIDSNKIAELRIKYADIWEEEKKFLNIEYWLRRNFLRVAKLSLHKTSPQKILDIGTGAGYFPYICKFYGHKVIGIDVPDIGLYNDMTDLLNITRVLKPVNVFKKLPDCGMKFDIVTSFRSYFNFDLKGYWKDEFWGVNEWRFFLEDLANNQLRRNGKVYIILHPRKDNTYYTKELKDFFLNNGAIVDGEDIFFKNLDAFHSYKKYEV